MDAATYKMISENPIYLRKSLLESTASAIGRIDSNLSERVLEEVEKTPIQIPHMHSGLLVDALTHPDLSKSVVEKIIQALLDCVADSLGSVDIHEAQLMPKTLTA